MLESIYKFPMCYFHVLLVNHRIVQRSIYSDMAQKLLDLLNGHSSVDSHCRQCPAELVWMNFINVHNLAHFSQSNLNTTYS